MGRPLSGQELSQHSWAFLQYMYTPALQTCHCRLIDRIRHGQHKSCVKVGADGEC